MPPPGNTAALAAAGLTVATMAGNPVADARGVILPANDAAALRGEQMLNPAGHTVAGNPRRSLRSRLQGMPQGGMARLLLAMGALGHTGDAGQEPGRAAGRASVCSLVSISVVTGSFQKKTKP